MIVWILTKNERDSNKSTYYQLMIGGKTMIDKTFQEITNNIKNMVSKTQLDIMLDANSKLINLYYNIGKTISNNYEWGNKFVDNLALE